jgi:predicted metal-dependent enzyme (double-stranded beta helix superfamily)
MTPGLEKERLAMFDTDRFIADCREGGRTSGPSGVLEVVSAAVTAPAEILHVLGEPRRAGVNVLYRSAELTILNLIWGPQMCQLPHDHRMWAVIGIYTGREDNIFWRRSAGDPAGRIEAAGAKALGAREAVPLGPDIIHSVINPISRLTGAIHVYGGDFFAATHSQWDPERLLEEPYDVQRLLALFEESNRLHASG